MNKTETYYCIQYGRIDVLIQKNDTTPSEPKEFFHLDNAMASLFNEEINIQGSDICRFTIGKHGIISSPDPVETKVPINDLCILYGVVGEFLAKKGIIGFRFHEGKMQYLLDIETFAVNSSENICIGIEQLLKNLEGQTYE